MLTDAHNHLQFFDDPEAIFREAREAGVDQMMVNGTEERDWEAVTRLAESHPEAIIPNFGLHPWQVGEHSKHWLSTLRQFLEKYPKAGLGECGLDRWKEPYDLDTQTECLRAQINLANDLTRPLTIHCLKAWGPLLETLQDCPPQSSFLIHAYSGSSEMVPQFAELGAYFSFSGYFLHERKENQRATFRDIPQDRILLETDAPSMTPPAAKQAFSLPDELNHPGNLPLFLEPLSGILELSKQELVDLISENFSGFWKKNA
jgi:TatD DNase family protein